MPIHFLEPQIFVDLVSMKKYLFIVLLVGVCFGQEILPSEYSRCSIDGGPLVMTLGGIETKTINDSLYRRYRCDVNMTHQYWILHWKYDVDPNNPCNDSRYIELTNEIVEGKWSIHRPNKEYEYLREKCVEYEELSDYKTYKKMAEKDSNFYSENPEAKKIVEKYQQKLLLKEKKNPCNDEKYVSLLSLEMNEMTDREFQYFLLKEKQCGDYLLSNENKKTYYPKPKFQNKYNDSPTISNEPSSKEEREPSVLIDVLNEVGNFLLEENNTLVSEKRCPHDGKQLMKLGGVKVVDGAIVSEYQCYGVPNHSFWYAD